MKTKLFLILPLIALFAFTGCNEDDTVMESQYKRENNFNKPGDDTILDIALAGGFNELAKAIGYVDEKLDAGLGAAISSNEIQLTVFAPIDDAFFALYDVLGPDVTEITDIPAETVLAVLQYHLTNGRRGSNSVVPRNGEKRIQTLLNRASFTVNSDSMITPAGGATKLVDGQGEVVPTVQIGELGPETFNISASNGIVHVIDAVLLPPSE